MRQPLSGTAKERAIDEIADRQAKYVGTQVTSWGGSARDALEVLLRATSTVLAVYEAAHKEAEERLPCPSMKSFARAHLETETEGMLRTLLLHAEQDGNTLRRNGAMFHKDHAIQFQATEEDRAVMWLCAGCREMLGLANEPVTTANLKDHVEASASCSPPAVEELELVPGGQIEIFLHEINGRWPVTIRQISFFLGKHLMFHVEDVGGKLHWLTFDELRAAFE